MKAFAVFLALWPLAALAETPLTAEAFEAYVTGRSLTYSGDSGPFGIEHYHDGRRVTWAFTDQECQSGRWYPKADLICFVYHDGLPEQCWQLFLIDGGLRAAFVNADGSLTDYTAMDDGAALVCPGAGV